jgi:hypothetical protein
VLKDAGHSDAAESDADNVAKRAAFVRRDDAFSAHSADVFGQP